MAPLGQVSRRLEGSNRGRFQGGAMARMPLGPWIIVVAVIGGGGRDEADAPGLSGLGPVSDQLGGGAGLAGGPAAEQQPGAPVAVGRPLGGPGAGMLAALAGGPARRGSRRRTSPRGSGRRSPARPRRARGDAGLEPGRCGAALLEQAVAWARSSFPTLGRGGVLEGGVVGDGHQVGQDGAGGLELDGLGCGLRGEAWRSGRRRRWRCR